MYIKVKRAQSLFSIVFILLIAIGTFFQAKTIKDATALLWSAPRAFLGRLVGRLALIMDPIQKLLLSVE